MDFFKVLIFEKECELKSGTTVYKIWHDTPVPFYISIYVFDLINEIEFLNGTKPHLVQRGPFVYRYIKLE